MENASKALLMAGGVLITILMVSLVTFAWDKISKYQASKRDLANITSTAQFNEQFANYQRDDVQGYELLTLIHKVIDYNERNTEDSLINANAFPYINLEINMKTESGEDKRKNLTIDDQIRLFEKTEYKQDELSAKNRNLTTSFEYGVEYKIQTAMNGLTETQATKVAKSITAIFLTQEQIQNRADRLYGGDSQKVYTEMASKYNVCTGESMTADEAKTKLVIGRDADSNKYYKYACMYYEYMQFKRSVFKCTELSYDDVTGRVIKIVFNFDRVR